LEDGRTVCLFTDPITPGGNYTVTVSNVRDLAGNPMPAGVTVGSSCAEPPTIVTQPASLTVPEGASVSFSAAAIGTPPPVYQWLFNDEILPGATSPVYSIPSVQPAQVGAYSVLVSSPAGAALSQEALLTLTPRPVLQLSVNGTQIVISWTSPGTLEQSSDLESWEPMPGATTPYSVMQTETQKFYRLRCDW
jgi:hypothetical protein